MVERLDAPHVDVRRGGRLAVDGHPGEHRLLVVRGEAETGEPAHEIRRRRAPADPPLAVRDPSAGALVARPRDRCLDVVESQPLHRRAVPPSLEEELVAANRLEAGPRQHVRGCVLG
jgi:hypothetical protein